ncbi:response regulator transcription factor [Anaerosporobacter faecicola]|uniref:response regulator transcription factor n=1 Tax=Anaerosporobacter faecicola TaxID=2718714 RepID=UPI00143A5307|nr:response regulator transcription factor [Anaerosporobacter faecicola]
MTILVAEDEEDIRNMIEEQLLMEGYAVKKAADGFEAWQILGKEQIDLALLDVMMPKLDGFSLLRKIRETSDMPVIFVTARGEEMDKVAGLSQGADDYLVKPFGMAELSARVAVQCRHLEKGNSIQQDKTTTVDKTEKNVLACGKLSLNTQTGVVTRGEELVSLNAKEYQLLQFFMENKGKVLTKRQIYQAVWQEEYLYDDNTIMVHLSRLRNKIETNPKTPEYLVTKKGIGYKLDAPQGELEQD